MDAEIDRLESELPDVAVRERYERLWS